MADAETNWIDFYISLSPVFQTGIWAGVSVAALVILRHPIKKMAEVLVRRMNQGDTISTPWISIEPNASRERTVVEQVTRNIRAEILHQGESEDKNDIIDRATIEEALVKSSKRSVDIVFPGDMFETTSEQDTRVFLYLTDWVSVSDFLSHVYLSAQESGVRLPVWTYGSYWILRNTRTGDALKKSKHGFKTDSRPFKDLDVHPGDVLVAERVK